MRRTIYIMLFALLAAASTHAQSGRNLGTAEIPFDFVIAGETLPAGTYSVEVLSRSSHDLLMIRDAEGCAREIFKAMPVETRKPGALGRLVFRRHGEVYFLTQLSASGEPYRFDLFKSRRERLLERELLSAAGREKLQSVQLAMRTR